MKIYLKQNVLDKALERIERLFNEFQNVVVSFSGGKDSTITLELALIVARKLGRLPLPVLFLDQEAEWQMTIDYVKEVMSRPEIKPIWIQTPYYMPNSLSQDEPFFIPWEEGKEWMRDKDPIAIQSDFKIVDTANERPKAGYWYEYFITIAGKLYPDEPAAFLTGVRAQESPKRERGLTDQLTYKDITWGKKLNVSKSHYNFCPVYDWALSDVWKAIHDHKWAYCPLYDELYRQGVPFAQMRLSSLNHESALKSLYYLHEIEGKTWGKLTKRVKGINQAKHINSTELLAAKVLPNMFSSWKEYRDYLTDNLILESEYRGIFTRKWSRMDLKYADLKNPDVLHKAQIKSVIVNDHEFAKLANAEQHPQFITYRRWKNGQLTDEEIKSADTNQIPDEHLRRPLREV